ncbi:MAG: hypothetical protein A2808_03805 [Candidatus Moranbacteria bacterium RIFCSPHIGHO2_01_FULL_55_24]|nr:MAG: hypothetical protein A2808_03805 [Candidatus Moranbacteria bacterium RIFCSPHIGHO2_01_FULL_55_24]
MTRQFKGFIEFIREQGVAGLAVGFILGGAVSKVVTAFVTDIVNPLVGIFLGAAENLKDAKFVMGDVQIMWGDFAAVLIDFIIISAVIYGMFKILGLEKLDKKKQK